MDIIMGIHFIMNLLSLSCRENSSFQHNHFSGDYPGSATKPDGFNDER